MRVAVRRGAIGRVLWWAQGALLACGILLLGYCGFAVADAWVFQRRESTDLDRLQQAQSAASESRPEAPLSTTAKRSAAPVLDGLIGRLEIPRLLLSAIVCEGTGSTTLRRAVGHIPGTALPGQPGNVALAGHRDTFFRALRDLRLKDEIQISTPKGNFKYEVESLMVVEPENVGVLAPSAENVLTLVTCYPFSYIGSAPKRFIARARQVSPRVAPPSNME
ncbi:MAG: class D sortase [Bryobacteraceae bacterium]|nr:class D sortase [Bryobacteraceae bacterium]